MAKVFHLFTQFPPELRDKIWNFAIRPDLPAVHSFKLNDTLWDTDIGITIDAQLHKKYLYQRSARLVTPIRRGYCIDVSTIERCGDSTPSVCLLDGGLWTACKESRLAIQRYFNIHGWNKTGKQQRRKDKTELIMKNDYNMPKTSYFSDHSGTRYFTVFPNKDLFFVQAHGIENDPWNLHRHLDGLQILGLQNMAVEYSPKWGVKVSEVEQSFGIPDIALVFAIATIEGQYLDTLWLVDYDLKRKHHNSDTGKRSEPQEGRTFYAADRKFTEVIDDAANLDHWEHSYDVEGTLTSPFSVLRAIQSTIEDFSYPEVDAYICRMGVLACEFF